MSQTKRSLRPKIHPNSMTTIINSPNSSEYFLEATQFNNMDARNEEYCSPQKTTHIPVLKNFHHVIIRSRGEDKRNAFSSIPSYSQEKSEPGESIEKREVKNDFRRSLKLNFDEICLSTKVTPRIKQETSKDPKKSNPQYDQNCFKDSRSLSEILNTLEAKDNEIRKLKQTNTEIERDIKEFTFVKEQYEAAELKSKLEKCDEIIQIYYKLLQKTSKTPIKNDEKSWSQETPEKERFQKTFPSCGLNHNKRTSIEKDIKSVSDLYFNESVTGDSIGTTKISTGQNISLYNKLYEKVHSNASLLKFDRIEGNFTERNLYRTIDSIPNSYRGNTEERHRKKFVLKKSQINSRTRFNLTLCQDFPSGSKTERNSDLQILFSKNPNSTNITLRSLSNKRISSDANTTGSSKKEKSTCLKQDLIDLTEKLKKVLNSYQLREDKLKKQTDLLYEKISKLESKVCLQAN